ncbi:hypothetical protein [Tropicibacter oceani]|uniref:Uncharacterized protein n=1 Tax=Tropicibacter oceani TaxID=3058420 RepID=A0ABY8QKE0_9RHOB|nr:hypothetical protein [Tropicibacter oceani]WGW04287.1 hypothetical protein QF118_01740 [Tropicibacter oceani]
MKGPLGAAVIWCLTAMPVQAQTIPLPFPDDQQARQISVTVTPGRRSMKGLPADLVAARRRMHDGQPLTETQLRRLAESDDGLAAQLLVRRLLAEPVAPADSDVAYFSAIAVGAGRVWTLPDMIDAMKRLDPDTEPRDRVRKYIQVLYPHAWAGNTLALSAVVEFNGKGRLFGALSDATRDRILAQGQENADGRVELRMALALLEKDNLGLADRRQARKLLDQASKSTHLGVMATAQNLLGLMDRKYAADG